MTGESWFVAMIWLLSVTIICVLLWGLEPIIVVGVACGFVLLGILAVDTFRG